MSKISGAVRIAGTPMGLEGVMVKATESSGEVVYTISDAQGHFLFDNLKPGEWKIVAMKEDYHQGTAKRKLNENQQKKITFNLTPLTTILWNNDEFFDLYQAGHLLSGKTRSKLGLRMPVDVYIQDPFIVDQIKEEGKKKLLRMEEWEPLSSIDVQVEPDLMDGPTSSRIAVVDYDANKNQLEEPVRWNRDQRHFYVKRKGETIFLTKDHCELPQFHQVNVWAIVQKILNMYEETYILGRPAPWAFEGNRLILVPHAGEMRNAFYDRNSKSIQFFYFHGNGKTVYTCISHDIIAHETGHAILDGLRPYYLVESSIQTSAFHEFVADTTAIMAAFLNNELRFKAAKASGGDLARDEIISSLAEEFGYYSYGRPYLRTAQDPSKMSDVQWSLSQYEWAQVLTGTMFDILKEMLVIRKTKPKATGGQPTLKEAFSWVCNRFRRVVFQPLDYLPPVDVQFSDYARAVLRADEIVEPSDEDGYRKMMVEVFKNRGIDYSEETQVSSLNFYDYDISRLTRSRTDAYHFINDNRRQLCIPAEQDVSVVDLYHTDKTVLGLGKLPREFVIQYVWREDVELKEREYGSLQGEYVPLLCGGTLVFDSRGNILSWQRKPGAGKQETGQRLRKYCKCEEERGAQRREQLLSYIRDRVESGNIGLQEGAGLTRLGIEHR